MEIFFIILGVVVFILFTYFAARLMESIASGGKTKRYCESCGNVMRVVVHNIRTGQVLYECPECKKWVLCSLDEIE